MVLFLSPHNEFFFVAFLLSLLLFSILLVFSWSGEVLEQNCSRKSQSFSGILENSFALIYTKILENIKKMVLTSHLIYFFQSTFITRTTITGIVKVWEKYKISLAISTKKSHLRRRWRLLPFHLKKTKSYHSAKPWNWISQPSLELIIQLDQKKRTFFF